MTTRDQITQQRPQRPSLQQLEDCVVEFRSCGLFAIARVLKIFSESNPGLK